LSRRSAFCHSHPGGMSAISRWLRSAATTPPVGKCSTPRPRSGSQQFESESITQRTDRSPQRHNIMQVLAP
jgi:hypothetical protein